MNWPDVMREIVLLLESDTELIDALGGAYIFPAPSTRPVRIPSIEWRIVSDYEEEVFNPITVQFDYWAKATEYRIETRLRVRLNRPGRFRTIGGIYMATLFEDSFDVEYEPGFRHKMMRFQFIPLRRRVTAVAS